MQKIKIDDKEYDLTNASAEAKAQLFHLQAIEGELHRLKTSIAIHQTARTMYLSVLKRELESPGSTQSQPPSV